ncbi:Fic family protein [Metallibacterium scheffleri]|uniref:Fido domain-containing protein n=1 Tax=Metallibacterium scheffleri TaxID=993689 RepID=A0A4S3KRT0_9GAMM|nr:Fic family protein [Metallibacterium scheffleri]THD11666.1 hypothetical protein B1806_02725 [Metallibacterium scheffleri]
MTHYRNTCKTNVKNIKDINGTIYLFLRRLKLAKLNSLCAGTQLSIRKADSLVKDKNHSINNLHFSQYISQIDFGNFRHKLDRYFSKPTESIELSTASKKEATILQDLFIDGNYMNGLDAFLCWLTHINASLTDEQSRLRTHETVYEFSTTGSSFVYPTPSESIIGLRELYFVLNRVESAIMRSILLYVAVIYLHPFIDGNGRTARVAMNYVLGSLTDQPFVPWKEIMERSWGGYVIRMRMAGIFNEWDEIIRYFCTILSSVAGTTPNLIRPELQPAAM